MKYRYEFDETGGYDCMYGAFIVYGGDSEVPLFEIDCRHYGQRSCDWEDVESIAKAKTVADMVFNALNGSAAAPHQSREEK